MTTVANVCPDVLGVADLVATHSAVRGGEPCYLSASKDRTITFDDLARTIALWQGIDATHRLGAGTIGLAMSEPVDFARTFVGLLGAGYRVAPLDPLTTDEALGLDVLDLALSAIVTDADRTIAADIPVFVLAELDRIDATDGPPGAVPVSDKGGFPPGSVLLRSSGTTGRRKLIVLTEDQLLHTATTVAHHHQLTHEDRGFSPLPLFHVNAEVVGLLATLVAGSSLVLDDRFHRTDFWPTIARHEVTWINAVPAILAILSLEPASPTLTAGVRFARSASAPLAAAVLDRFESTTGIPVLETYGMTEAASQITANPLHGPRRTGSVGLPVGCELRVENDGTPCPPGITGSVHIRGAGIIPGPLPGGWLVTGDLGFLDRDGYLFLTGRTDDIINRGGEKIFPRFIEELLLADPEVAGAVVVGIPDDILGSVPLAVVTLVEGVAPQAGFSIASRLRARCEEQLTRVQRPARIDVVPALPVGATGKISRRLVREAEADLLADRWATA